MYCLNGSIGSCLRRKAGLVGTKSYSGSCLPSRKYSTASSSVKKQDASVSSLLLRNKRCISFTTIPVPSPYAHFSTLSSNEFSYRPSILPKKKHQRPSDHLSTFSQISATEPRSSLLPSSRSTIRKTQSYSYSSASKPANAFTLALNNNASWAEQTAKEDPELFPKLANGQWPQILWLGCSDSRCAETTLLGLKPGDVFVHRNIANVMHAADLSAASVIEFAVVHLKVQHVVLCGHTACGGANAALGNKKLGILDIWLWPLRRLREEHLAELEQLGDNNAAKALRLAELNVLAGVRLLKENGAIIDAVEQRGLQVHGVIYDVATGKLREIESGDNHEVIKARLTAFKTEP